MESRKRKRGGDQSQSTLFFHVLWHGEVQSNPPWRTAGYAPGTDPGLENRAWLATGNGRRRPHLLPSV